MSTAPAHLPGPMQAATRAQLVRAQVELALSDRFAGALSPLPRTEQETMPAGIAALDELLGGGLPLGAITELVGPLSSGRTGVAVRTVAAAMRQGNLCAWVDASDAFDPASAAANGVCLEQLLWVRCGVEPPLPAAAARVHSAAQSRPAASYGPARAGQHPRDEVRGLDHAVGDLLRQPAPLSRNRSIGTPGALNRALSAVEGPRCCPPEATDARRFGPVKREEQVSSDRQPRRGRGGNPAGVAEHSSAPGQAAVPAAPAARLRPQSANQWTRLDQALRAADLLLQGGGFRVLVLDLGGIAPAQALKIPLATWFRFRAAADHARTVLLALTQVSCARSSAGLVVQLSPLAAGASGGTVLESLHCQAEPFRQRSTSAGVRFSSQEREWSRKPPKATWQTSSYPAPRSQHAQGGSL